MRISLGAFWELGHSSREKGVYLDLSIMNDYCAAESPQGCECAVSVVPERRLSSERSLSLFTVSESLYQHVDSMWFLSAFFFNVIENVGISGVSTFSLQGS